ARALRLSGEAEAGRHLLGEGILSYRTLRSRDFWTRVDRPQFEAIGRQHGVNLAGLETLEPLVERRRRELEELSDPAVELAQVAGSSVAPDVVASARALANALMLLARGEEVGADVVLADISPDFLNEVGAVRAYMRVLANQRRHEAMAAETLQLASTGDNLGAKNLLVRLIDDVPEQAHALLKESADGEDRLVPVAKLLVELAHDQQYHDAAASVVELLDVGESGVEPPPRDRKSVV